MLLRFHAIVNGMVVDATKAIADYNANIVDSVIDMKKVVAAIINPAAVHASKCLMASEPDQIEIYTIEIGITENLQCVYYFAKRIAKENVILEATKISMRSTQRTKRRCK